MITSFRIGSRSIGKGSSVYVIAEMSANHGQKIEQAYKIIEAAAAAGADAIKLQTYTPDTLTLSCHAEPFQIKGTLWDKKNLYDLYSEAFTPWEWQPNLKKKAEALGLDCFSSPFDATSVDFLEKMGVPAYKIASFELVDHGLIQKVAQTRKPLILSTGMATLAEIDEAVRVARKAGACDIALLKCTSAYPSPPEEMNLRTLPHLSQTFGVPAGLSDHTLGIAVPVTAVALGACIIEKHLTLSRSEPGPDTAFSLEPHEFQQMVEAIRCAEKALGECSYTVGAKEKESRTFRRSLFVVQDIPKGAKLTKENIRSIRPGHGLPPACLPKVLGQYASYDLKRGTPLSWEAIHRA